MWHFIDLIHEQKLQRREYLDWAGFIAQVSVLVPLLVLQGFAIADWIQRYFTSRDGIPTTPSSPYAKHQRLGHKLSIQGLAARWRIFLWWCGTSVDFAGLHLGTRGEVLLAGIWTIWLLVLCMVWTGDDYMHLTKRFGIVGASQMPFHYLLALKSPYSPLQLLTRRSQESLIAAHQLLGRIITFLFYLHVVFYVYFFIYNGLLLAKLAQFFIICGVIATVAFTAVGTTALKPVRDWSYRVFYITHVVLATLLLPILYFHVHHIRIYVWQTLAVYVVHMGLRFFSSKTHTGSIKVLPGANLVEIDVPLPLQSVMTWQPGQHTYVSLPGQALLRTFRSNPFTVASIPSIDGKLRFVARILDGNTAKLAKAENASQKISVEGPYGIATHPEKLLRYDRVLFVAGGVGATFVVPLYRQLLADLSPSKGSHRRQKVSFLWVARSMADVSWALPKDTKEREGFTERLRVYLTTDVNGATSTGDADFTIGDDDDQVPGGEGIELEEQKKLLSAEDTEKGEASGLAVQAGRPDLTRAVEQMFTHSSTERVAMVVCGPRSLSHSLRKEVGRWVHRGRECLWWTEEFGL